MPLPLIPIVAAGLVASALGYGAKKDMMLIKTAARQAKKEMKVSKYTLMLLMPLNLFRIKLMKFSNNLEKKNKELSMEH